MGPRARTGASVLAAALLGGLGGALAATGCTFELADVATTTATGAGGGAGGGAGAGGHETTGCTGGSCTTTTTTSGTCSAANCNGNCCASGDVCHAQSGGCCTPVDCGALTVACGMHDDGCGNPLACGPCGPDLYCLDNQSCQSLSVRFASVPAGTFTMGSPGNEPGRDDYQGPSNELDETAHQVTLTRAFEIATSEITQGDYGTVTGENPSFYAECGAGCPVETVTWDAAASFCNRLSEARGLAPCFMCTGTGNAATCAPSLLYGTPAACPGYRLPTEAEWEYAARGATQSPVFAGSLAQLNCSVVDPVLGPIAWYLANSAVGYGGASSFECQGTPISIGTHPVGQKATNAFGLSDVAGNVWEWVLECPALYPAGPQLDPLGPLDCGHDNKLYRGGGLGNVAIFLRHAERAAWTPDGVMRDIGFRPVRTLP